MSLVCAPGSHAPLSHAHIMYGAIIGDVIGSPYMYINTAYRYFDLGKGVRGWSKGREVRFTQRRQMSPTYSTEYPDG